MDEYDQMGGVPNDGSGEGLSYVGADGKPKKKTGPLFLGLGVGALLLILLMGESKASTGGGGSGPNPPPPKKDDVPPVPGGKCQIVDQSGNYSTKDGSSACPKPGVQSNPNFQWMHEVAEGEGPIAITQLYFGGNGASDRFAKSPLLKQKWDYAWVELVDNNPKFGNNDDPSLPFPVRGDRNNPNGRPVLGPDGKALRDDRGNVITNGVKYNFRSLPQYATLLIPKSWNPYIDETGKPTGTDFPYPAK